MNPRLGRRLRYGMVGGGPGAFIGEVHRQAAALDGEYALVAGAFSSTPEGSRTQGEELGLAAGRVYDRWEDMVEAESRLAPEERIDAVSIVTPNHLHFPMAKAFMEAGVHVICDKPVTTTLDDAEALCRIRERTGTVFALTHNYTGYPMVKEARELVRSGRLGTVRKVVAEYSQGWLSTLLEATGQKQASWRGDPGRAGPSSALGDIGSHADNLTRYVTGLRISQLCADLTTLVDGRRLEDDANALLRFDGGARGVLIVSQISVGEENGLRLRVYGSEAALSWYQERPNELWLMPADGPRQLLTRGHGYLSAAAGAHTRLPPGHPEGFIEAFANIYQNAGRTIGAVIAERAPEASDLDYPTDQDGAIGMHFIEQTIAAAREGGWVDMTYHPPGTSQLSAFGGGSDS